MRLSYRLVDLVVAAIFVALLVPCEATAQWKMLGPAGGYISSIAVAPDSKAYAISAGNPLRMFRFEGGVWTEIAAPSNCAQPYGAALQTRDNGDLFLHCGGPILRSRDSANTWTPFTPNLLDGSLIFDSALLPSRAYVGTGLSVSMTLDDGASWLTWPQASTYRLIAFDRFRGGRLTAVGTEIEPGDYATTKFYKSVDDGATWITVSTIVPPRATDPCYQRTFAMDNAGRFLASTDCGLFRSVDAGVTWQTTPYPADRNSPLAFDATNPQRVVAALESTVYESRNAGASWAALPPLSSRLTEFKIGPLGDLWSATADGAYTYDAASNGWASRNAGLYAHPINRVEPRVGARLVLSTFGALPPTYASPLQSTDGGRTWLPYSVNGATSVALGPNISDPRSLFSVHFAEIQASDDGGVTWNQVAPHASTSANDIVGYVVPVGPQPGVVYGAREVCVPGFDTCWWTPQGIAKSVDGGATWTKADAGISHPIDRFFVSPVGTDTLIAGTIDGLYLSRDGAQHWQLLPTFGASLLVPDPAEAARWYAVSGTTVWMSVDYGEHWTQRAAPDFADVGFDLVIDGRDVPTMYAVGRGGELAISRDRAASWTNIAARSTLLSLAAQAARIAPPPYTALYAAGAQGVTRFDIANYQGLWWNPSESGWGVNLAQQGDLIYLTWYTYDEAGRPSWLAMLATRKSDNTFTGDVIEVHGSPYTAAPYDAAAKRAAVVGSGTLTFADDNTATFAYSAKSVSRTVPLSKYPLGGPAAVCAYASQSDIDATTNYQGLWWGGMTQDGWGINVAHEGDRIYATWYAYDIDGSPTWFAALLNRTSSTVFDGSLIRASGPPFGGSFDASRVSLTTVGTATLTFADGGSATWTYRIGSATGSKAIRSMVFAPVGTACH